VLDKFLPFGQYEYRFLINDNQYIRDPGNPRFGGVYSNSILWVLPEDIPAIRIRHPRWGSVIASSRVTIRLQLPDVQTARSIRKRLEITVDGRRMRVQLQNEELYATAENLSDGFHWLRIQLTSKQWPITWQDSLFFIVNTVDTPAVPRTSHFMLTPARNVIELNGGLSYDPDYDALPTACLQLAVYSEVTRHTGYAACFHPTICHPAGNIPVAKTQTMAPAHSLRAGGGGVQSLAKKSIFPAPQRR